MSSVKTSCKPPAYESKEKGFSSLKKGIDRYGNMWGHERCKSPKCKGRRNMFGYDVPDEIWEAVVPENMRRYSLCLTCFDEYAQEKRIKYRDVLSVWTPPITWEVAESYE